MIEDANTFYNSLSDVEGAVIISFVGLTLSIVLYALSPYILRFLYRTLDIENQEKVINRTQNAIFASILFPAMLLSTRQISQLQPVQSFLESVFLSLLLILWILPAYTSGIGVIRRIVGNRYDAEIIPIVQNTWLLVVILMTFFLLFEAWGISVTPLLASAGVIGIVLGLAARETISNFFGSIALYADNTYEKGDFIEVDGQSGFVKDISIRSTQLRTLKGDIVTIPNSRLHKSVIENRSAPVRAHRIEPEIGVSYDTDPDVAASVIEQAVEDAINQGDAEKYISNDRKDFRVFLHEFSDSAIIFKVFVWIDTPSREPILRDILNTHIYQALDEADISIPFPQRTIHMKNDSTPKDGVENLED